MFERITLQTTELQRLLNNFEEQWDSVKQCNRQYTNVVDSISENPMVHYAARRQHVPHEAISSLTRLGITLLHVTLGETITRRLLAFGAATVATSLFFMAQLHPAEQRRISDVQSTLLVNTLSNLAIETEPMNATQRASRMIASLDLPAEYSTWIKAHVDVAIRENSQSIN